MGFLEMTFLRFFPGFLGERFWGLSRPDDLLFVRAKSDLFLTGKSAGCGGVKGKRAGRHGEDVSPASLVLAALRKSMVAGSVESPDDVISRHVTFDRFNGFLGVHLELDVDVPVPVPSASVCLVHQQSQCSVLMIQKETVSPLFCY